MSPEEALRTFVNALPTPAVLVREGHVLMNSPAQQLLGYSREEIPTPVSTHSIAQELIEAVRGRLGERAST